jgi:hypothetical protein
MGHRISQQHLFAVIHDREFRATVRSLRQSFAAGDVGNAARAATRSLIRQEHLMRDAIAGTGAPAAAIAEGGRVEDLVTAYEQAHHETRDSLSRLTAEQWESMIEQPLGFALWPALRRGELLWMALRDTVDQAERLVASLHLPQLTNVREA